MAARRKHRRRPHRVQDHRLRGQSAHGHAEYRAGPRRSVHRRARRSLAHRDEICQRRDRNSVETRGECTIGRTVVDHEKRTKRAPNCHVAFAAERDKFFALLKNTFAAWRRGRRAANDREDKSNALTSLRATKKGAQRGRPSERPHPIAIGPRRLQAAFLPFDEASIVLLAPWIAIVRGFCASGTSRTSSMWRRPFS